jgi:hypothetical protein
LSYQLVIKTIGTKASGEGVPVFDLPSYEAKIYALYYPGEMIDDDLENKLREFGNITGKNLFINIGRLNDPNYDLVISQFEITTSPVVVVTAISELASIKNKLLTVYVKIDSERVLKDPQLTVKTIKNLFYLFMQNKISGALSKCQQANNDAIIKSLKTVVIDSLKELKSYLSDKDWNVSLGPFSLEVKGQKK